jgi:predicted RNase H-like nuclease (RuvC/YqgF family)
MMAEEARVVVPELERAEIPWVVAYLREDIQDVRGEIREVRRSIQRLDTKVDELRQEMDAKIEELHREMSVQFRWLVTTMVAVGALVVAALKLLP